MKMEWGGSSGYGNLATLRSEVDGRTHILLCLKEHWEKHGVWQTTLEQGRREGKCTRNPNLV